MNYINHEVNHCVITFVHLLPYKQIQHFQCFQTPEIYVLLLVTTVYTQTRQLAKILYISSRGPVFVAGLSLNKMGDRGPTPQPQGVRCGLP